jgi:hypothetical protein
MAAGSKLLSNASGVKILKIIYKACQALSELSTTCHGATVLFKSIRPGGGDRGQGGQIFKFSHLPNIVNGLSGTMIRRLKTLQNHLNYAGDRGQMTDFGHGHKARDRGQPN